MPGFARAHGGALSPTIEENAKTAKNSITIEENAKTAKDSNTIEENAKIAKNSNTIEENAKTAKDSIIPCVSGAGAASSRLATAVEKSDLRGILSDAQGEANK